MDWIAKKLTLENSLQQAREVLRSTKDRLRTTKRAESFPKPIGQSGWPDDQNTEEIDILTRQKMKKETEIKQLENELIILAEEVSSGLGAVKTAEEIDKATRRRFTEAPATVVAEAMQAKYITIALQTILRDMRLNSPEAGKASDLLEKQANALDNIIEILRSDGDKETAQKTLRDLLYNVLENFLNVLAERGSTKGILAAAALALLSLTGVQVTSIVALLVGGSIVGLEIKALKKILSEWKKKKEKGE